MSLFQHSVLNKYLKETNQTEMKSGFEKLVGYFHNPVIQQNIRESKEEQFQEGFLRELFVNVLGYTINPNPEYNLTTEYKNERGAKKADGAILQNGAAIGVIELKSTTTKDLESIRLQAFDYKANQSECVYVITSNFEKIRFYINNAVDFEEFDLFKIKYEEFQLLWLCLAKENLLKGIPLTIKEDSVIKEENVTKQIYIDYAAFKRDLYNDLIENNLDLEIFSGKEEKEIKLLLFKKSQKLLDRFLFIFFGEDRGLLPPNSISEIIKQWESQSDWGDEISLYDRYKKYFHLLNTGWKGKKYEIYAYNGGLFALDEILDSIVISDELLKNHTEVLTAYDFETDVDVNILGHIFENSLNEIEEITAQIEGAEVDLKKSKRKKDGVFYTPKYITKYIVENTVGKLCEEKKTELAIEEGEYLKSRKGRTTKKLKELDEKLAAYRNWLLTLTICDPACGSGAFLNQALDFLIREHNYIDELKAKLLDVPMIFTEVENSILENNIYGVDINEESVEIAKLSLWLRTAQKGRKLTTLSNNIKCGNSLIDDPEIAGEKAFNWQNEFPDVFREKKKQAWHITTATHNSRASQRMWDLKIEPGEAVWLDAEKEVVVTRAILEIVKEDKLNVLQYNICGDHMHIMLLCEKQELNEIVAKIKGRSSYFLNRWVNPSGQKAAPKYADGTRIPTWTRKFNTSFITNNEKIENTINYIKNNRNKHQLPENKELQSIIPEMLCTRKHAFRTEYSGGFDVVIGNPPYVRVEFIPEEIVRYFKNNFTSATSKFDLSSLFFEKSIKLLNEKGIYSIITSYQFIYASSGIGLRKFICENTKCSILKFSSDSQVFEGATTYAGIFIAEIGNYDKISIYEVNNKLQEISIDKFFNVNTRNFSSVKAIIADTSVYDKIINKSNIILGKEIGMAKTGVVTSADEVFFLTNDKIQLNKLENELIYHIIGASELDRWVISTPKTFCLYPYQEISEKTKLIELDNLREDYPNVFNYLQSKKEILTKRSQGRKDYSESKNWYQLNRPREKWIYDSIKIIYPGTTNKPKFAIDEKKQLFRNARVYSFILNEENMDMYKTILPILNSKITHYLITLKCPPKANSYYEMSTGFMESFPFILPVERKNDFIEISNISINLKKDSVKLISNFLNYLSGQFELNNLSKKLQNWHNLEFGEFIKELKKAIKKSNNNGARPIALLTKMDEMEWMEVFETKKAEAQSLKSEIDKTDREIDQMVYELYGLTEEEIGIVEETITN